MIATMSVKTHPYLFLFSYFSKGASVKSIRLPDGYVYLEHLFLQDKTLKFLYCRIRFQLFYSKLLINIPHCLTKGLVVQLESSKYQTNALAYFTLFPLPTDLRLAQVLDPHHSIRHPLGTDHSLDLFVRCVRPSGFIETPPSSP